MPVLKNPRHEKFAQGLAKGNSADAAHQDAGFKANRHNAAALGREQHILTRVQELQAEGAERTLTTIESLTDELEQSRAGATEAGQFAAAVSATMGKAKLHGLLIDKKQLTGARGGPLQIADITRLKGMTQQELDVLERALVQIGLAEGSTGGEGEQED